GRGGARPGPGGAPRAPAAASPPPGPPPAAAPASAPAPAPVASPSAGALAAALLTMDHDRSYQSAVGQIQALWGPDTLERTSLRTHMEQVRRLNLPVVLEMFHPSRRDTCFVALLHLDGDQA